MCKKIDIKYSLCVLNLYLFTIFMKKYILIEFKVYFFECINISEKKTIECMKKNSTVLTLNIT